MITASVQQASQSIEIKGAPLAAVSGTPDQREEFRTALAANVRDNAACSSAKAPVVSEAASAADASGEADASLEAASCKIISSKQAQTGSPGAAKVVVAAGKSTVATSPMDVLGIIGTSISSLTKTSVGGGTSAVAAASEISSSAYGRLQTVSTESALAASPVQGDLPQIDAETVAVRRATLTIASNGLAAAKSLPANVPAISAANSKEPARIIANSGLHARKGDDVGANKYAASSVTEQTIQGSSIVLSVGSANTTEPTALLTPAPQIAVASAPVIAATEQSRVSERVGVTVLSCAPVNVPSGKAALGKASGDTRSAAVQRSISSEKHSAQPTSSAVAANQVVANREGTSQAVAEQAEVVQVAGFARIERDGRDDRTIARQTTVGAVQSVQAVGSPAKTDLSNKGVAALSNRSTGVSERVPVSTVDPGAHSSGAMELKSVSTGTGDGIEDSKLEAPSRYAPAVATGTLVTQHLPKSDARTGVDSVGKTKTATGVEVVAAPPKAGSPAGSFQSADVKPVDAQIGSSVSAPIVEQLVAGQRIRPAELPRATIPGSVSISAAGKDKGSNRPSNDLDATAVAPQSASSTSGAGFVPVGIADGSKDGVHTTVASGALAVPSAYPVATATTVPAHAGGPASASAQLTSMHAVGTRTEAGDGALAAQSSSGTQSVEQNRTLLATPSTLEVGVQSGTQGWLKIRAEVGGEGEVKASLDAVSSSGRDLLHSQLPALNAFLHSEQISVTASVAERSLAANGGVGGAATESGGYRGGDGSGIANGSLLESGGGQQDRQRHFTSGGSEMTGSYDALGGMSDVEAGLSVPLAGASIDSGRWLNVRV